MSTIKKYNRCLFQVILLVTIVIPASFFSCKEKKTTDHSQHQTTAKDTAAHSQQQTNDVPTADKKQDSIDLTILLNIFPLTWLPTGSCSFELSKFTLTERVLFSLRKNGSIKSTFPSTCLP